VETLCANNVIQIPCDPLLDCFTCTWSNRKLHYLLTWEKKFSIKSDNASKILQFTKAAILYAEINDLNKI